MPQRPRFEPDCYSITYGMVIQRIRDSRMKSTQVELSRVLPLSSSMLCKIECGYLRDYELHTEDFARAFYVSVEDIRRIVTRSLALAEKAVCVCLPVQELGWRNWEPKVRDLVGERGLRAMLAFGVAVAFERETDLLRGKGDASRDQESAA